MVILLNSYKKNDHCISHTVIIILLLNSLKGPLAYQIKTTTTTNIPHMRRVWIVIGGIIQSI